MIKIQVICDKCKNVEELCPVDSGNNCYVHKIIESEFYIEEINIDAEVTDELEEINALDDTSYISIDRKLLDYRIRCMGCGDYIIINGFDTFQ